MFFFVLLFKYIARKYRLVFLVTVLFSAKKVTALSPEEFMRTDTLVLAAKNISRSIKSREGGEIEISHLGGEWKSFAFKPPWNKGGLDREQIVSWLGGKNREKQYAAYVMLSFVPFVSAVNSIAEGVKNADIWIRWDSLLAFEKLQDLNNAEYLLPLLSDISPTLREKTLLLLGEMKYDKARDLIISLIWDDNGRVRSAALYSLSRIFGQETVVLNSCREAIGDPEQGVRFTAARILAEFPPARAVADLGNIFLNEPEPAIRRWIAETFEKWKEPKSVKYLIKGLKDQDEKVREKCRKTLDSIQKRSELPL